jgi:hypothetical protein
VPLLGSFRIFARSGRNPNINLKKCCILLHSDASVPGIGPLLMPWAGISPHLYDRFGTSDT